ncbi:MAG: AIR synthase-related protein [Patescibacteria group bacterium]|nr:AIR synthase-related protein [Patescibacteria group bacterium]MCL5094194.1 AIR synthase-related protein [Patescibacteria group bacterium]
MTVQGVLLVKVKERIKIMAVSYKDSGVNIELGNDASKVLYEAAKKTWENRKGKIGEVASPFDDFSGVRVIDVSKLPEGSLMCLGFDGVGTKVEIAERLEKHNTVAYDLFAMVCDDAVIRGGEPAVLGSVLDINSLESGDKSHIELIKQLAFGYINAAKEAGVAVINGEMAELGARVSGFGAFNYNWCAGLLWFAKKERLFTGKEIKVGDQIVALKEKGFRSNGLSLVRKILKDNYSDNWHKKEFNGKNLAELVLEPSKIYSKAICQMNGGFLDEPKAEIHGVAHITGGGIPGKLGRVLKPSGLGARLDNLFKPCELMLHLQKLGGVPDEEAYKTWNMGQGMLVVTPEPEKVIEIVKSFNIEAQIAGEITAEKGIEVISRGFFQKGRKL